MRAQCSTRWTSSASAASRSRRRRARRLEGPPAQPDRHARPRRLHLRGLALAAGVRGRAARRRRRQGIEAQTLANATSRSRTTSRSSRRQQDRPARADPDGATRRRSRPARRSTPTDVLRISPRPARASTSCSTRSSSGPAADRRPDAPLRALIFDSSTTSTAASSRSSASSTARSRPASGCASCRRGDALRGEELGFFARPDARSSELGRRRGRLRDHRASRTSRELRVGDTLTDARAGRREPLPGLQGRQADGVRGLFPTTPTSTRAARRAREAEAQRRALFYEPETSQALGFGFRCGFLGLLHMEIVRERLEREFDLDLIVHRAERRLPRARPTATWSRCTTRPTARREIEEVEEPYIKASIITPPRSTSARSWSCARAPRRAWRRWSTSRPRSASSSLRAAARRDRARLLRPAEVAHAGYASFDYDPAASARATSCASTCSSAASRSTRSR
jgi:hypothetical protein